MKCSFLIRFLCVSVLDEQWRICCWVYFVFLWLMNSEGFIPRYTLCFCRWLTVKGSFLAIFCGWWTVKGSFLIHYTLCFCGWWTVKGLFHAIFCGWWTVKGSFLIRYTLCFCGFVKGEEWSFCICALCYSGLWKVRVRRLVAVRLCVHPNGDLKPAIENKSSSRQRWHTREGTVEIGRWNKELLHTSRLHVPVSKRADGQGARQSTSTSHHGQ